MDKQIWKFLKSEKSDSLYQTHVSLFGPKGKFCINRNKTDKFWKLYCQRLYNEGDNIKIGLAEKPQPFLPVLVDVDIAQKIEKDENEEIEPHRIYKSKHVKNLIQIYQSVLKHIVDEVTDEHLYCIYLNKDPYVKYRKSDNSYFNKHGFHLHFPFIFLNKLDQETHLIPRVKKLVFQSKIFSDLGLVDSSSVIDTSYTKVPWLIYGSRKDKHYDPYIFKKMYNEQCVPISLEEGLKNYEIKDKDEQVINFRKDMIFYLPRILSIIPYGREVQELKSNLPSPNIQKRINKKIKKEIKKDIDFQENIGIIKKLVNMLSRHRASDHNEWIKIGWILYNIGNGCEEALQIWLNFSRKCSEKFDEGECISKWERMVKKGFTVGTLKWLAQKDSPNEYDTLKKENIKKCISESLNGSHNDVAKVLYEMYGNNFVCASIKYKLWYRYENHHWEEMEEGVYLRSKISGIILKTYTSESQYLFKKLGEAEDTGEKAMYEARIKQVMKLMNSLKSAPFKNNVMKECMEVFYDGAFLRKLDKNPYLIGFKNGVYDTRIHSFREGIPDDFISLQMNIDYKIFEKDAVEVKNVEDFLMKVFPDTSIRNYFMDVSSDVFVGGNQSKLVQVWTGEGDNAKSITQILFEKMLGRYAVKLPTSLIIGKRTQSSAACPELVRAGNGVRFAVLQEPDQKDIINIGILKELSGNDTFFARDLHKSGGEITPMFKLILICNEPPQLPYDDKAVWNRIRVIPYESTFCDDAPETLEEQLLTKKFPKDREFADKIPSMIEAFAYILLEHRKKIKKRIEPKKVILATEQYKKKNNIYRHFIEECIIEDENTCVSLTELWASFKDWFKESVPNQRIPTKNDVKNYFIKAWGEPTKGVKWNEKRIRTLQDDVENGEAIVIDTDNFIPDL